MLLLLLLQVQLVNPNTTRKVRAHAFLFFNKSFLAPASPLPRPPRAPADSTYHRRRLQTATLTALTHVHAARIDRPTIEATATANTNARSALRHRQEMRAFVVVSEKRRGTYVDARLRKEKRRRRKKTHQSAAPNLTRESRDLRAKSCFNMERSRERGSSIGRIT